MSLRMIVRNSFRVVATGLMSLISWLSNIPLYISTTSSLFIFSFQGHLGCIQVEALLNREEVNIGVPVSCQFLFFPRYTPMSGSALSSVAHFFRCFSKHSTLLHNGRWQFTFPLSASQGSLFSSPCPAFLVFTLYEDGPSD